MRRGRRGHHEEKLVSVTRGLPEPRLGGVSGPLRRDSHQSSTTAPDTSAGTCTPTPSKSNGSDCTMKMHGPVSRS
jgi:hypothetical protein